MIVILAYPRLPSRSTFCSGLLPAMRSLEPHYLSQSLFP